MIELKKIKVKTYEQEFYNSVNSIVKTGMTQVGKSFARKVREKTPVAIGYPRSGKLRKFIRADQQSTMEGNSVYTKIGSYARTSDKRKKSYGIFAEFGSPTIPAYNMFARTVVEDLDKIIARHILTPLKKLKIKHS